MLKWFSKSSTSSVLQLPTVWCDLRTRPSAHSDTQSVSVMIGLLPSTRSLARVMEKATSASTPRLRGVNHPNHASQEDRCTAWILGDISGHVQDSLVSLGISSKNIFQKIKQTCISLPIYSSLLLASKRLIYWSIKRTGSQPKPERKKIQSGSMVLREY